MPPDCATPLGEGKGLSGGRFSWQHFAAPGRLPEQEENGSPRRPSALGARRLALGAWRSALGPLNGAWPS